MGIAIALRDDYDGAFLRRLAKASSYTWQVRRLLSLAEIYDGGKRTKAARGSRPTAPRDQRTQSAWIFGAICLKRGVGADGGIAADLDKRLDSQ